MTPERAAEIRALYNPKFLRQVDAKRRYNPALDVAISAAGKRPSTPHRRVPTEAQEKLLAVTRARIEEAQTISATKARRLIDAVAAEHGMTYENLVGHSRQRHFVKVRDCAIRLLADAYPNAGLHVIASLVGNRDHTTILHSLRKTKKPGQPR